MQSNAKTVTEYLSSLPPERRKAMTAVRKLMRSRMPKGYQEGMQYGMICWSVPLTTYPAGYLGKKDVPLPYAALASQRNYMAVHLMSVYGPGEEAFRTAWKATGKKLDMGRSCIRFKKFEDLALDLVGQAVASFPVNAFIAKYEAARKKRP